MATETLIAQHTKLRDLCEQIRASFKQADATRGAVAAREIVSKMAGTLTVHLAAEDQGLYPRLVADKRSEVSEVARRFQQEMGGLKDVFGGYVKRWPSDAVAKDAAGFSRDTLGILAALATRMDREERELYPLAK